MLSGLALADQLCTQRIYARETTKPSLDGRLAYLASSAITSFSNSLYTTMGETTYCACLSLPVHKHNSLLMLSSTMWDELLNVRLVDEGMVACTILGQHQ